MFIVFISFFSYECSFESLLLINQKDSFSNRKLHNLRAELAIIKGWWLKLTSQHFQT